MSTAPRRVLNIPNVPRRIATLSVHTSPLDQPGTGDAGGLNVYVVEVAKRLAARGIEVDIFTRAVCRDTPPLTEISPGVLVRSVVAGPFEELDKTDLPAQVCEFTLEVLRAEAEADPGRYDLVHAHYWLSGKVGAVAKERWGVPLVQSMHTLGKVKNAALAAGDAAEPDDRIRGELDVVATADRLIANTTEEARQLTELYGADPAKVRTVSPGADLSVFTPGGHGEEAGIRRKLGIAADAVVLVFAGRVQPLKGPDVVLKAAARLIEADPELARRLLVVLVGGPSGRSSAPIPTGCVSWRPSSGLPTSSGSSRLARKPSSPTGTARPRSCSPRRTRSRSGLSHSRPRPAARPWWRPAWAGCARSSGTITRVSWCTATTRRTGRRRSGGWCGRRGGCDALSKGALRHASTFGWSATVDRLATVYTGAMDETAARVRA